MKLQNPSLKDIRAWRADIAVERRALDAKDAELAEAEKLLEKIAERMSATMDGHTQALVLPNIGNPTPSAPVVSPRERLVVDALEQGSLWKTVNEIQKTIADMRGIIVPIPSLSPRLTGLKLRGIIIRDGMKIALNSRVKKEGKTNQAAE